MLTAKGAKIHRKINDLTPKMLSGCRRIATIRQTMPSVDKDMETWKPSCAAENVCV